jgi:hypothetical protein
MAAVRVIAALLFLGGPCVAEDSGVQILQIYRDTVKPGKEAAYRAIEEDAAGISARLGFPNPHLAIESLTGPKEVWWLNSFASETARQQVVKDYEGKPTLVAALAEITLRRLGLVGAPIDILANYRPDLGHGQAWSPAGARFFVVTLTRGTLEATASVFEAPDGTRYFLTPVRTLAEAESTAAGRGGETRVFAVRPYWGMAAKEWIAADPEFWKPNPMARAQSKERRTRRQR